MTQAIHVNGVTKTFLRPLIPIRSLQDRLLHPHATEIMRIDALKDVTVTVQKGEWIGCYGPNGSGKTTFLKTVAGLLRPSSGDVNVQGTMSPFFELGIGFHPEKQAYENIRLHGMLLGLRKHEIRDMTRRVLDFAGIGRHAELPMKCYSTGMRLRLAFASSIEAKADIYLFDEIFAVGDADFKKKCQRHFEDLKTAGKTVLIVSHDRERLQELCDRVLFFREGTVSETDQT